MKKVNNNFATVTNASFWKRSVKEMKSVQSICVASMMTALNTLLGTFKIILIPKVLIISFASLAIAPCAIFCGPLVTATAGAIADILKYILYPDGEFFLGFTINEFLIGLIYGMFFYRTTSITWKRCALARLCIVLLIHMILTPLWLYILYGNSFWAMVSARLLKNIIMYPIDVALLYGIIKTTQRILKQIKKKEIL